MIQYFTEHTINCVCHSIDSWCLEYLGCITLAQGMIDSIKMAFEHRLGTLKWMDDTTREAALVKAQAISDMIGYPSFIEDETALDAKYSGLQKLSSFS